MRTVADYIDIVHDDSISISTGRSRKETNWKLHQIKWSDFVNKTKSTHRTAETYSEYISFLKARQDEIKDVGGFVGGLISGGRRKPENILNRQLLTLDVDYAEDFVAWENFKIIYGNAALMYTTHKHNEKNPRFRIVIPLSDVISKEQYEPLARKIADELGINDFDDTTFQVARLMYYPSTSIDGEFVFDYIDNVWLNPADVLSSYADWRDISLWPVSDRTPKIIEKAFKKQEDPLIKKGIVGAFCRAYTITEVIDEFLSDAYEHLGHDRYSYKHGSTSGGLIVYEDKFAYSHHNTDPISGRLCNAFDLVRIHKFGFLDEKAKDETPINKLPSYIKMKTFASQNNRVKKIFITEKFNQADLDFKDLEIIEESEDTWHELLSFDTKGQIKSTIDNILIILKNDRYLKKKLGFDDFEHREILFGDLPWRKLIPHKKYMIDTDDSALRHYLEKHYEISGPNKISDALKIILLENQVHPVKDYLKSLSWDKVQRVDNFFIDYLGVSDELISKIVTRKSLVACVKRIFEPGCKYDYVLTLVGKAGVGKSFILKRLGQKWFSDSLGTVTGKEAYEQLQGVWIVEMGELSALRSAEVEQIKQFITKQDDRYRVAYGKRTENFPRQCVFFGTTNNRNFLKDPTGNRRFWPLDVYDHEPTKNIFIDLTDYEISQIWAEAMELYKNGEELFLTQDEEKIAKALQDSHKEINEKVGLIENYLEMKLPKSWDTMDLLDRRNYISNKDNRESVDKKDGEHFERTKVCGAEIWCELFRGEQKDLTRWTSKEILDILLNMEGWEEDNSNKYGKYRFNLYGKQKTFVRKI